MQSLARFPTAAFCVAFGEGQVRAAMQRLNEAASYRLPRCNVLV